MKNKRKPDEGGFILPEVLLLAMFVAAVALSLVMYQTSVRAKSDGMHRLTAVHLAQTEFAHLEQIAATGNIKDNAVWDWLGEPSDLTLNNGAFTVTAKTTGQNAAVYLATVDVVWRSGGRERQITWQRLLVNRGGT